MRKLFFVFALVGLMAIPPALASSGDGPEGTDVSGALAAVPSLRPPASFAARAAQPADEARALISSSIADPLDHQEARDRLIAATVGARREREREADARAEAIRPAERSSPDAAPGGPATAVSPQLEAIAACESGGNPSAVGGGGAYRGKYQFSPATWQAVGGSGDPAAAPEAEQDRRAAILYAQSGASQWPSCAG